MDLKNEGDIDYGLELMKWAKQMADDALAKENDSDYVVNEKQMEVFIRVNLYFQKLVNPDYGEWVHAEVSSPKEQNGRITVRMGLIDFTSEPDKIKEFCQIIGESISFGIDPNADGESFDISLVIPNIFIKKEEKS